MAEAAQDEVELKTTVTPPRRMGTRIDSPSASVVQVESSKLLPFLLLSTLLSAASIMGTVWALHEANRAALESRLLMQQVMDMQALMVREGLRKPEDFSNGPAGNIQYKRNSSN